MRASGDPPVVHDVTLVLSAETLTYPGDPPASVRRVYDIGRGDPLTSSALSMGCHVGTHVDAPAHFLASGATVDQLPIESLYGPGVVVDLTGRDAIRPQDLAEQAIPHRHHILLKTDNSRLLRRGSFCESYCTLSPEAARALCELAPRSIGFDYYSLDPFHSTGFEAHRALAERGIAVFVCLDLEGLDGGTYTFVGLPLRLTGAEAAPARVLLIAAI
jgi:arylformamidase